RQGQPSGAAPAGDGRNRCLAGPLVHVNGSIWQKIHIPCQVAGDFGGANQPAYRLSTRITMQALKTLLAATLAAVTLLAGQARGQDVYKSGASVARSGYAVSLDRPWRDGLELAAEYVNSRGGIMGRKIQLIAEDNKSEPQEAVTVYRKMISSDKVDI